MINSDKSLLFRVNYSIRMSKTNVNRSFRTKNSFKMFILKVQNN